MTIIGGGLLARRPAYYYVPATTSGLFHSSAARPTLKEGDQNRDHLGEEYEAQKQDQLRSTRAGRARWKQELASNSEASVKADRGEIDTVDTTPLGGSGSSSIDAMMQQGTTKDSSKREGAANKGALN